MASDGTKTERVGVTTESLGTKKVDKKWRGGLAGAGRIVYICDDCGGDPSAPASGFDLWHPGCFRWGERLCAGIFRI